MGFAVGIVIDQSHKLLGVSKVSGTYVQVLIDAADQELIAQGVACGAAGLVGGFASDGSLSKTSVADAAGAEVADGLAHQRGAGSHNTSTPPQRLPSSAKAVLHHLGVPAMAGRARIPLNHHASSATSLEFKDGLGLDHFARARKARRTAGELEHRSSS